MSLGGVAAVLLGIALVVLGVYLLLSGVGALICVIVMAAGLVCISGARLSR